MKFSKYGSFKVYVDDVYLLTVPGYFGDVLDLVWPIHYNNPDVNIQIVADSD